MKRYGKWSGNPNGTPENIRKCIQAVFRDGSFVAGQCSRRRGHGRDDLYCKQHAKQHVAFVPRPV